jgi:dGTPase
VDLRHPKPSLATQHQGQRHIIKSLFETYKAAAKLRDYSIFPQFYQEELEFIEREFGRRPEDLHRRRRRLIADLISGMTEQHAVEMCHRLTGVSLGSVLDYLER